MVLLVLLCLLSGVVSVVVFTEWCSSLLLCLLSGVVSVVVFTGWCTVH